MAFSAEDIVPDSPTNNFATFNVLTEPNITTGNTFSEGNLKLVFSTAAGTFTSTLGSTPIPNNSGVWYWEVHYSTASFNSGFGVYNENTGRTTDYGASQAGLTDAGFVLFNGSSLNKVYLDTKTEITDSLSSPIIFQLIFDAVNRKLFIKHNDTEPSGQSISSGTSLFPVFSAGKTYIPAFYHGDGGSGTKSGTMIINHGQDPTFAGAKSPTTTYPDANGIGAFYHQPPAGAKALCTANLPDFTPTVVNDTPQDYFQTVLYTGQTNSSTYNNGDVTVGFQPDLVWIKMRDTYDGTNSYSHYLYDSVRGINRALQSNSTNQEETNRTGLTSFNQNGFSLGTQAGENRSGNSFVSWCFRAGGSPTADNSNTSGAMTANSVSLNGTLQSNYTPAGSPTIYPTRMSINTDAGFSIVKYTGTGSSATVPHGLSSAPEIIFTKGLDTLYNWNVSSSLAPNGYLELNTPNLLNSLPDRFIVAGSSTNTLTSYVQFNENNKSYIAYCWHSVENYSKCGSYVGNGSADGPFVYCGFRPAWVMVKRTDSTGNWFLWDNQRLGYNVANKPLFPNLADVEDSGATNLDLLSNGFKFRNSGTPYNASGATYIFMAFAEQPFKYTTAR